MAALLKWNKGISWEIRPVDSGRWERLEGWGLDMGVEVAGSGIPTLHPFKIFLRIFLGGACSEEKYRDRLVHREDTSGGETKTSGIGV